MARSRLLPLAFTLLPALLLAPFLAKPFNVDDTAFVKVARQILADPARPYEGMINWYDSSQPIWDVNKNPPLVPYVLAAAFRLGGETERAAHLALLPFAMAAGGLTYHLAGRFTRRPALAAALFLLSPAFLGCAVSVMLDVPALALGLGALALFLRAEDRGSLPAAAGAGALLGLAALAKYPAILWFPILGAIHLLRRGRPAILAACWSCALGVFAVWCLWGLASHGSIHFIDSLGYGPSAKGDLGLLARDLLVVVTITVSATGAALVLGAATEAADRRPRALAAALIAGAAGAVALAAIFRTHPDLGPYRLTTALLVFAAIALGAAAALRALAAAAADTRALRLGAEPDAWKRPALAVWFGSTAAYVGFLALPVAVRFLLPALPAAVFLIVDAFDRIAWSRRAGAALAAFAVVVTGALGLAVAESEARWAAVYRDAAKDLVPRVPAGRRLFFDGHWGFQYYMEKEGARIIEFGVDTLHAGDFLLRSEEADPRLPIQEIARYVGLVRTFSPPPGIPLVTMNHMAGAGFHHSTWGLFPYAFSDRPPDVVHLLLIQAPAMDPPRRFE